jgi:hypothetical protein
VLELAISFSSLPIHPVVPRESESSVAQSHLAQTTTVPDDHVTSAVDHPAHADALPIPSSAPHKSGPSAVQSPLPQTTTFPDDDITSAVDHAAHNADALRSPAGLETGILIIDTIAGSVGPVQSALAYAESLKATLECLDESVGYLNGVIGLVKDFAEVCLLCYRCFNWNLALASDPPYIEDCRRRLDQSI